MISHAEAMRRREGETYVRVVIGQFRHWRAEVERLGLVVD
jgi:hypothetical protein